MTTRSFSLPSESIPYFLGVSLLRADSIVFVSPWISDIDVEFPVSNRAPASSLELSKAFKAFPENEYTIVTSEDSHNVYLLDRVRELAAIKKIEELHAKAIITDDLVYVGSANITLSGVGTNKEFAQIIENDYNSVNEFASEELGIEI